MFKFHHLLICETRGSAHILTRGGGDVYIFPYKISLYGQENPRGTKKIPPPHPDQAPGRHQVRVKRVLSPQATV